MVIELETDLECTVSGTFADPYTCNKYYSCVDFDGEFEVRLGKKPLFDDINILLELHI